MASGPELTNEQEIVMRFNQLLEERNALSSAAIERGTEVAEHDLVIRTLQPLHGSRKCYRLFGDVLVERTVSEVLPSVQEQKSNLASLVKAYEEQLDAKQKEVLAFQKKYNIRVKGEDEGAPVAKKENAGRQGVLV